MRSRSTGRRLAAAALLVLSVLMSAAAIPAAAQDAKPSVAITSVDLNSGTFVLTNHGDTDVDPNGLIVCNFPFYAPIEGAETLAPGASITIDSGALGVELGLEDGELGIYTEPDYENSAAMVTYVEWGSTGHQRSSVAIRAEVWAEGVAEVTDGTLTAGVTPPVSPADWAAGAGAAADEPTELADTGVEAGLLAVIATALVAGGALFAGARRRLA